MTDPARLNALGPLLFDPRYREWMRSMGGAAALPEMAAPGGDYDYAAAIRHGVVPETYAHDPGQQHWQSVVEAPPYARPVPLKSAEHPTAWMEQFMATTGVDPHEADAAAWARARAAGAMPRFDMPAAANRLLGRPGDQW